MGKMLKKNERRKKKFIIQKKNVYHSEKDVYHSEIANSVSRILALSSHSVRCPSVREQA